MDAVGVEVAVVVVDALVAGPLSLPHTASMFMDTSEKDSVARDVLTMIIPETMVRVPRRNTRKLCFLYFAN